MAIKAIEKRIERLEAAADAIEMPIRIIWRNTGNTVDEVINAHLAKYPDDAACRFHVIGWAD